MNPLLPSNGVPTEHIAWPLVTSPVSQSLLDGDNSAGYSISSSLKVLSASELGKTIHVLASCSDAAGSILRAQPGTGVHRNQRSFVSAAPNTLSPGMVVCEEVVRGWCPQNKLLALPGQISGGCGRPTSTLKWCVESLLNWDGGHLTLNHKP